MECEKKTFETLKEAYERLHEIATSSDRDTKPIRVYKCKRCSKYHLTSKTKLQHKKNLSYKKKEKAFIKIESEHWNRHFGIIN